MKFRTVTKLLKYRESKGIIFFPRNSDTKNFKHSKTKKNFYANNLFTFRNIFILYRMRIKMKKEPAIYIPWETWKKKSIKVQAKLKLNLPKFCNSFILSITRQALPLSILFFSTLVAAMSFNTAQKRWHAKNLLKSLEIPIHFGI